ncbi:uncharacterized protein LOC107016374 [Solanum pennellii]|uniref:Uncharacterized protein LOC107016374 n=1 Tax=Solanum pennellii TaxID=28526 RepID=A0ABM1GKL1_SOLPN|nr:uncharacterized protein LOC107016374 [Solanum pennellii]
MGDHDVEFGRILDYKDELLRTNPGSSCVVKVDEHDTEGKSIFQSFYICFDALKKAWIHCRKCIGLDGCFLKGVCKVQLLVVVARDGNSQMLPLAWAIVEKENKHTWTMFVKCIRDDLGLGDGKGLTLITDIQKETPSTPSEGEPSVKRGRGRPKKTSSVAPSAPPLPTAPTDFPASSSAPPTYHASSSIAGTTKRGRGRGRGNTSPEKKTRSHGNGCVPSCK